MDTQAYPVLVLNVPPRYLKRKATHGKLSWRHLLLKTFLKMLPWKMQDSHESYAVPIMTMPQYSGPPPPITELTLEQDLKMRQITDALEHASREDLITVFLALQRQCYILGNNMSNLLKEWNKPQDLSITSEALSNLGISYETKD